MIDLTKHGFRVVGRSPAAEVQDNITMVNLAITRMLMNCGATRESVVSDLHTVDLAIDSKATAKAVIRINRLVNPMISVEMYVSRPADWHRKTKKQIAEGPSVSIQMTRSHVFSAGTVLDKRHIPTTGSSTDYCKINDDASVKKMVEHIEAFGVASKVFIDKFIGLDDKISSVLSASTKTLEVLTAEAKIKMANPVDGAQFLCIPANTSKPFITFIKPRFTCVLGDVAVLYRGVNSFENLLVEVNKLGLVCNQWNKS